MSLRDRFGGLEQARAVADGEAAPPRSAVSRFSGIAPVQVEPAVPPPVDLFAAPADAPVALELDAADASPDGTRICMQCAFANSRFEAACRGCGTTLEHAAQRRFDETRAIDARKRQAALDAELAAQRTVRQRADDAQRQAVADAKLAEVMVKVEAIAVAHGAPPRRAAPPVVEPVDDAPARVEPEPADPRFPTAANPRPWAGSSLADATRVGGLARANHGERLGLMIGAGVTAMVLISVGGVAGVLVAGVLGVFIASLLARWQES